MNQYHRSQFVPFAIAQEVLLFGEYELKSGRISPYFFNAGLFNNGAALYQLGHFYAHAILTAVHEQNLQFDMLFGPAYKGISLATATAMALSELGHNVGFAFNRKEAKTHGEGGSIVGAPLKGRVLIIDDVITAGTAINESVQILNAHHAQLAGVMIALNRQERGQNQLSAIAEVEQKYQTRVYSIASFADLLSYAQSHSDPQTQARLLAYRQQFGVTA